VKKRMTRSRKLQLVKKTMKNPKISLPARKTKSKRNLKNLPLVRKKMMKKNLKILPPAPLLRKLRKLKRPRKERKLERREKARKRELRRLARRLELPPPLLLLHLLHLLPLPKPRSTSLSSSSLSIPPLADLITNPQRSYLSLKNPETEMQNKKRGKFPLRSIPAKHISLSSYLFSPCWLFGPVEFFFSLRFSIFLLFLSLFPLDTADGMVNVWYMVMVVRGDIDW
jgi:hypothetical protein